MHWQTRRSDSSHGAGACCERESPRLVDIRHIYVSKLHPHEQRGRSGRRVAGETWDKAGTDLSTYRVASPAHGPREEAPCTGLHLEHKHADERDPTDCEKSQRNR